MRRVFLNMLKVFDNSVKHKTVYDLALNVLKSKDKLSKTEHVYETLLRTRIVSSMGVFIAVAQNAASVKQHLIDEPTEPIPRLYLSQFPTSELYTMHQWIMIGDSYATMAELIEFVQSWVYLTEVAQTIKSGIQDYNVHSATPQVQKYKAVSRLVESLEQIVLTLLEYFQCYDTKKNTDSSAYLESWQNFGLRS